MSNREIISGRWEADDADWTIYESDEHPSDDLYTASGVVAVFDQKVVLTKGPRGLWEILAGHIEAGESPQEAARREALEEGGFSADKLELMGFREITTHTPPLPGTRNATYPYPKSYIVYYRSESTVPLAKITGEEITESRVFTLSEIDQLLEEKLISEANWHVIQLSLNRNQLH